MTNKKLDTVTKGNSYIKVLDRMSSGTMMALMPRMRPMLTILLPTMLPTARSPLPDHAEKIVTMNSGKEVPKATIVRPITKGDTLSHLAKSAAPSTKKSAPLTISTKLTSSNNTIRKMSSIQRRTKELYLNLTLHLILRTCSQIYLLIEKLEYCVYPF